MPRGASIVRSGPGAPLPTAAPDPTVTNSTILGWNFDPITIVSGGASTPTAATIYLAKIPTPKSTTITNIIVKPSTAGTSYTNAQLGLWNSAGTFLSASAVQASAGTNGFGVTTPVTLALSAAQAVVGSPTAFVWVGLHMGTNNATAAIFSGSGGSGIATAAIVNIGTTTATLRFATYTGHATNALANLDGAGSGNLTPTSMTSAGGPFPWFGIS